MDKKTASLPEKQPEKKTHSSKKKEITSMEEVRTLLSGADRAKYEIAEELGVVDKVFSQGWRSLTAKESGRIGGIMASRKRNKTPIQ